ncbi:hypothetical protein CDAR_565521 [Caerostris darwini]|uniref:Uncharacterized protein n=1 Tax=Caerostris darwini TaxID=1538125 RepID=A0AAV4TX24_9ARAC|nr:hypothetical protein CDAR_565521 [Caerostris darwini]
MRLIHQKKTHQEKQKPRIHLIYGDSVLDFLPSLAPQARFNDSVAIGNRYRENLCKTLSAEAIFHRGILVQPSTSIVFSSEAKSVAAESKRDKTSSCQKHSIAG